MNESYLSFVDHMSKQKEVWGLYGYADNKGNIVYIGVDRHINKALRHKDHLKPSKSLNTHPRFQEVHAFLQKERWTYEILVPIIINKELAKILEREAINFFQPKFNILVRNK